MEITMKKNALKAPSLLNLAKLPKSLMSFAKNEWLSLAVDCGWGVGVIEITECFDDETQTVKDKGVQKLIDRADTYTEYVQRCGGIRIIGVVQGGGPVTEIECATENDDVHVSVYRNCDRWVDLSGIPIVDKPLRHIDDLISEHAGGTRPYIYLNGRHA
jgi:hypothetical protein